MRAQCGIGVTIGCLLVGGCSANGPAAPAPIPVSTFARPDVPTTTAPAPATAAPTPVPTTASTATTTQNSTTDATTATSVPADVATTTAPATTTTTTLPPDPPPPNDRFDRLALELELVADVYKPTGVAWRTGDSAMYVSTQPGPVLRVDGDSITSVIDFTGRTFEDAPGSERGVLGIAFDPRDQRLFLNYTDLADDTQVVSYELVDGVADPDSRRTVLSIDQPGLGHNGGRLAFDAEGNLYIGSGDGGASNGWDAQDTSKLLGTLLRIRPLLDGDGYEIPTDNPFADGGDERPEVIARGFRNPWTFSIDDDTGDIWIGDVGNNTMEEISLLPRSRWGANFGWPYVEGTDIRRGDRPDDLIAPVYAYGRDVGTAVMGGHVYRGAAIPELRGAYLFGDLTGPVWAIGADGVTRLDIGRVSTFVGWAEDPDGELYLLGFDGVYRMVAVPDAR